MPRPAGPSAAGVSALNQYAWTIYSALQAGATTTEIWNAVKGAAGLGPGESLGASIFDMNYVAGQMRAIANANQAVANADPSAALDPSMWAWGPWSEITQGAMLEPRWQVRYQMAVQAPDGSSSLVWRSYSFTGSIEGLSVGDLMGQVQQSAGAVVSGEAGSPPVPTADSPWVGGQLGYVFQDSITIIRT